MSTPSVAPQVPKVRWDLSSLFSSIQDPKIERTWEQCHRDADEFVADYKGKVGTGEISAEDLAKALQQYEQILTAMMKPTNYAGLVFQVEMNKPENGAFMQAQQEKATEVRVKLIFFDLELQKIPEQRFQELIKHPALSNYVHFLNVVRIATPYMLSEKEEALIEELANTGSRAWVRLFEELTGNHTYSYKAPGQDEVVEKTESEVLAMLRDSNREVRKAAAECFSAGLEELSHVLVFNYNNLIQDHRVEDRLRGRKYPEHARHMSNELEKETVDLVMQLCKEQQHLVSRFYHLKREILGLPELTHIDRYAPLFDSKEFIDWDQARAMVLDAFNSFSPEIGKRAEEFFDKGWIDAEPRQGKGGGAFCSYNTPDLHPVVMVNYLNKSDDVMTLAHELGHGVHASLSRKQTLLNYHGTLPLAELASIFGEILVFEDLVKRADTKEKLALYAEKIESIFATVFRQAAMFRFEQRSHEMRRSQGELTAEEFGELWQEELQGMFGDSVKLGEEHKAWWSYVGHFIFAPFYVYAYSFGELLTLSIYQLAKKAGPDFANKYVHVLELGGSKTPAELMALLDVDLNSREFWLGGFEAIETMIQQFESIWGEYSA